MRVPAGIGCDACQYRVSSTPVTGPFDSRAIRDELARPMLQ